MRTLREVNHRVQLISGVGRPERAWIPVLSARCRNETAGGSTTFHYRPATFAFHTPGSPQPPKR